MTLAYEGMDMEAEHGLTFTVYTAEPGSKSEEAMRLLASWAASERLGAQESLDSPHEADRA
jgi:hypothetical protein